jgi:hypothetical protein
VCSVVEELELPPSVLDGAAVMVLLPAADDAELLSLSVGVADELPDCELLSVAVGDEDAVFDAAGDADEAAVAVEC